MTKELSKAEGPVAMFKEGSSYSSMMGEILWTSALWS